MSDLISRSELISIIEREYREYGDDYDIEQILGDIEDMPTAFDADKVVSELEKNASRYTKKYVTPYGNNGNRDNKAISIHKAIDIVKRGGKE